MFDFELTDEQKKEINRLNNNEDYRRYKQQLAYYRRNRDREVQKMRERYRKDSSYWVEYYKANKESMDKKNREYRDNYDRKQIAKLEKNIKDFLDRLPRGHRCRVTPTVVSKILREEIAGRVRNYLNKDKNMKQKILCIVGESGSGKTLASLHLKYKCGANVICSYTTRPPRDTEVEGRDHHFIDIVPPEEELLAFAMFGGYKYYATKAQVFGPCTVYVIDEQGIRDLMERHSDKYDIYTVYLTRERQLKLDRGVDVHRINRDKKRNLFDLSFYNYVIENNGTKRELFLNIERIYNEIKNK